MVLLVVPLSWRKSFNVQFENKVGIKVLKVRCSSTLIELHFDSEDNLLKKYPEQLIYLGASEQKIRIRLSNYVRINLMDWK